MLGQWESNALFFYLFQDTPPTAEFLANLIKPTKQEQLNQKIKGIVQENKPQVNLIKPATNVTSTSTKNPVSNLSIPVLGSVSTGNPVSGSTGQSGSSPQNWLSQLDPSIFEKLNRRLIPDQNSSKKIENLISLSKIANPIFENVVKTFSDGSSPNPRNEAAPSKIVTSDAKKPALDFEANFW